MLVGVRRLERADAGVSVIDWVGLCLAKTSGFTDGCY